MAEVIDVQVSNFLFDEENPRLPSPNQGQREVLRALAANQGAKLRVLAEDIVAFGLDPSQLMVVRRVDSPDNRYVVLDGNRRLSALRALENPELVAGAVSAQVLNALRRLSKNYQEAALDSVPSAVVRDDDEARHWIELKHMGERGGAGSVLWGSEESARFRARTESPEIYLQALDFLQGRGDIDQDYRNRVAVTTLRRLLESPDVRAKLGLEWSGQKLKALGDEESVAKALHYVVDDIASGNINVRSVYTREQRLDYANNLPSKLLPNQICRPGDGKPLQSGASRQHTAKRTNLRRRTPRARSQLIPRDCVLNVTDPRLRDIEQELRKLNVDSFPNAVSVMFRVFLELSADRYIEQTGLSTSVDAKLRTKLLDVTSHLLSRKKLTSLQAKPVRHAAQANSYLAPSVTVLHQYVHNPHMFPSPNELRISWDNLQSWFIAVWGA